MPATPQGTAVDPQAWRAILEGRHADPGSILGPRVVGGGSDQTAVMRHVRTFQPQAARAWLVQTAGGIRHSVPMRRTHRAGIFEGLVHSMPADAAADYTIRLETGGGRHEIHDPYAFPPMLTDFDIHLLGEGRHWKSYEKLGAQLHTIDGVAGVNFAVWAPNAESVSVVGDFNGWDGRVHQMHKRVPSGIW